MLSISKSIVSFIFVPYQEMKSKPNLIKKKAAQKESATLSVTFLQLVY